MRATLIGYKNLDFISKEGGAVQGTTLFVCYQEQDVHGRKCNKFFVNNRIEMPAKLKAGGEYDIYFNEKGKVEQVLLAE